MSKKHNLYISFAADDNAKGSNTSGWVDTFIRYLGVYIQKINNQSVDIIPIQGAAKRPTTLEESDGLILVVSENYIKGNLAKQDAALLADPTKVFKVDLSPIKRSAQPKEIRSLSEFNFFESEIGKKETPTPKFLNTAITLCNIN